MDVGLWEAFISDYFHFILYLSFGFVDGVGHNLYYN